MSVDYKSTVFLPRTDFPMRAGLPKREPEILARWQEMGLFARLRAESKGREKFILHDGPPYANGHLHMGHALNKVLKDVINRSQQMLGKDANYVPGWDCHGLPIEWKIEEGYRARGQDKDSVPIGEFRRECRDFAEKWVGVQTEEFKRLGVEGDWERPYTTMAFASEAQIVREIGKFLMNGGLYRGSKPVLWSVPEKTALADAEVEYHDHTSDQIWVKFPVVNANEIHTKIARERLPDGRIFSNLDFGSASVLIWTTTPWTIPGNRAICFSRSIKYAIYEVLEAPEGNWASPGDQYILARTLASEVMREARVEKFRELTGVEADELEQIKCEHPLRQMGYDFDVPMLPGNHVTDEAGTGFVHTAPGHGSDDYDVWNANEAFLKASNVSTRIPYTVDADGCFTSEAPGFEGKNIITSEGKKGDANAAVIEALADAGKLLARGRLKHSYPHSWRSKAPLIFRNTPQWFISMEANGLRTTALKAIADTRFVPAAGRNRLHSMIEGRPDWCISRQRLWGVPLPIFLEKATGEPLRDPEVIERVASIFESEGADCWYDSDPQRFLGNRYKAEDYDQVQDIVEVWFDSGSTHSYVLEARPELAWPASLYLEGSDQHRGWFHSSLLESCGTRGRAPFEAVLTHGFVLDEQGRKMSKSLGNVTAPQEIIESSGADILRLWVVASNYEEDLRIGPEILRYQVDAYRRLRNTMRYLLGSLDGFDAAERVAPDEMPELERWVLHRVVELDGIVRQGCADFDFHVIYQALHNFCAVDLSAFYFDVRKDVLYCDRPDSLRRRACRTVLDTLFDCLTAWLAPILCFTAEEAWWARQGKSAADAEDSVHLRVFPDVPQAWRDEALAAKWAKVREVRRVVTGALEVERAEKRIGSSLLGHPTVHIERDDLRAAIAGLDMAEICITSSITLSDSAPKGAAFTVAEVPGVAVAVGQAEGEKCQRCWRVLPEVDADSEAPGTCGRCADAVKSLQAAAQ
jgi:isoleucyl-tRNA synthetase